jgi:Spy/CpxP family protein refolding chaperone
MARHYRWALAALAAFIAAAGAAGSHPLRAEQHTPPREQQQSAQRDGRRDNPRLPWWKEPGIMAELGLSADQSTQIDQIFEAAMEKARPLRDEVKQLEVELDSAMRANTAQVAVFARQVDKIENKRAELNKTRTVMLYRMRRVLTAEQNAKFQAMHDRWEAARKKQDSDRRR